MKLTEIAEVCYGLVQEGRHPVSLYRPEWFPHPYDEAIKILSEKGASKEDVAKVMSSSYMTDAADAVHRFNGLGEYANYDWPKALQSAFQSFERGRKLQKLSKAMQDNEPVDVMPLYADLGASINAESSGLQRLADVGTDYKPFKLCGYEPLDKTLGGIPSDGPIIIVMRTGEGKSKLVTAIIGGLLNKYKDETAAVYTLEMNEKHWKWRAMNMYPSLKNVEDRLYVSGAVRDADQIVAEVMSKRFNYVAIDAINDLVTKDEASEYERVYKRIKELCRFLGIPVFVTAQPNRETKISIGNGERFPGLYDAAWSGASENSSALFLAGITTNSLDMKSEEFPTEDRDLDYLIARKSRDGWPADYDPTKFRGPGAIIMEHSPNWLGKPYGGKWKLWSPDSAGKKIGKKKEK